MRRLILLFTLLFGCAALGCGKKAKSDPEHQPESGPQSEEKPSRSEAREMGNLTKLKIARAFADNPQRAKKEYGNVRWRLAVRVDEIKSRLIAGALDVAGYGTIEMRSNAEVEKLSTRKPAIIEARISEFDLNANAGLHFTDGVFIKEASLPQQETPLKGDYELTAAQLKEMIAAYDRGTSRYQEAVWSISGTVVKQLGGLAVSYIIDVPTVGKVRVIFNGERKQPKVGDRVNLKATASELLLSDDDQPIMEFINKEKGR
jgi:hypothetical protein